jgi:hypothetical protein
MKLFFDHHRKALFKKKKKKQHPPPRSTLHMGLGYKGNYRSRVALQYFACIFKPPPMCVEPALRCNRHIRKRPYGSQKCQKKNILKMSVRDGTLSRRDTRPFCILEPVKPGGVE